MLRCSLDHESNDIQRMGSIVSKIVLLSIFALLKSFALVSFPTSQSRTAIGVDWHSKGEVRTTVFHTSYLFFEQIFAGTFLHGNKTETSLFSLDLSPRLCGAE